MSTTYDIPVLLLAFNRPDTTRQVISAIREVRPHRLYIAVDGARLDRIGEAEICETTKKVILDAIDWNCQITTLFRKKNVGCALGVSGAITWFLEQEEMGIILEDDCVPSRSFFDYCHTLLHYYQNDKRIMHISGFNIQRGISRTPYSYYFSRYAEVWGWATWRRAWQHFDFEMSSFSEFIAQKGMEATFWNKGVQKRWIKNFTQILNEKPPTIWGYRWMYSIWKESGLCVTPDVPLTTNIGFDKRAVHTKAKNHKFANIKAQEIGTLRHPSLIIPNEAADRLTSSLRYHPPLLKRVQLKINHIIQSRLKR